MHATFLAEPQRESVHLLPVGCGNPLPRWTPAQAARFLKLFGIRDAAVTAEIYRYITETPANYLKYYVGYLNFLDLKEEQQSLLGENFDLKSFHQKILEIGPVQFPVLRKYMNEKL